MVAIRSARMFDACGGIRLVGRRTRAGGVDFSVADECMPEVNGMAMLRPRVVRCGPGRGSRRTLKSGRRCSYLLSTCE